MIGEVIIAVPVLLYTALAVFSVIWTVHTGVSGLQREWSPMAKFLYWHGIWVVSALTFSAAVTFAYLFGRIALRE